MGTDSVVVTVQREICGYESTDLRTVTAHEQGMTIGSDDGNHGTKASGGIVANCAFVSWVRVRLDDRDARLCEQPSDKGANHCAAKTSAELICLGQELINPLRSRIGLALPPTSSTLNDDVRLAKANGFAVQCAITHALDGQPREGSCCAAHQSSLLVPTMQRHGDEAAIHEEL